jgi:hypothetical protein
MSFPFIDKTSSYQQAVGFMNTSGEVISHKQITTTAYVGHGLSVTSVTSLGLSAISFLIATIEVTGTPVSTGVILTPTITGGTSITFNMYDSTGALVTAGLSTGLAINLLAYGTPYYS